GGCIACKSSSIFSVHIPTAKIECPPKAMHKNSLRNKLRTDMCISYDARGFQRQTGLRRRYGREKLSNWRRTRRENRQRWKWKRSAYRRNEGRGKTDENGNKEPKRDYEE